MSQVIETAVSGGLARALTVHYETTRFVLVVSHAAARTGQVPARPRYVGGYLGFLLGRNDMYHELVLQWR